MVIEELIEYTKARVLSVGAPELLSGHPHRFIELERDSCVILCAVC